MSQDKQVPISAQGTVMLMMAETVVKVNGTSRIELSYNDKPSNEKRGSASSDDQMPEISRSSGNMPMHHP